MGKYRGIRLDHFYRRIKSNIGSPTLSFENKDPPFGSGGALFEFVDGFDDLVESRVGAEGKVRSGNIVGNRRRKQTNRNVQRRELEASSLKTG